MPAPATVERLARTKAMLAWMDHRSDVIVLGADTLVASDRPGIETVLGKPVDADDARRMLRLLSGTTHTVYTGIALAYPDETARHGDFVADSNIDSEIVDTQVTFREL